MSLTAKFIKAANTDGSHNVGQSRWEVHNLNKLVLNMTVDEIIVGTDSSYDDVATVEFGKWLIKEIRDYNADV